MTQEFDAYIFMPVGTSFLTNLKSGKDKIRKINAQKMGENSRNIPLKPCISEHQQAKPKIKKIFDESDRKGDNHPAEISSLYGFWYKNWSKISEKKNVKIFLLHSSNPVGRFCAEGINKLISDKAYFVTENVDWCMECRELTGLDPKNPVKFYSALDNLAEIISTEIKDFSGEIFVNISGGYKPLGNYLTMMAMALGQKIKVFYLYEESPEIHSLPTYPLAFDMLEWRDWRGMLLPFENDGVLTDDQKLNLFRGLRNTKIANFLMEDQDKKVKLNSVGTIISKLYADRDGDVSEFGSGGLLLDKFKEQKYADYLRTSCIPKWRHLAVGDHIPETVEHGRGHIQRLLELAQQLLEVKEIELSDEQLFVLIAGIWLHDIGHSGNDFSFRGKGGIFSDKNDPGSKGRFFIYDEPEKVRKYHNFLSWELIRCEREFLFPTPKTENIENLDRLIDSTALAALYHRRKMPVEAPKGGAGKELGTCIVKWGIEDFTEETIDEHQVDSDQITCIGKDLQQVIALLRFLDGTENQSERSGSNESREVNEWVIKRQVESLKAMQEEKEKKKGETSLDYDKGRLQAKIAFKKEQPKHFKKHQLVKNVFMVPVTEEINKKYVYPRSSDKDNGGKIEEPVVGVYVVENSEEVGGDKEKQKEIQGIIRDIYEEYMLVHELLPFRLVIFCIRDLNDLEEGKKIGKKKGKVMIEDFSIDFDE